MDTALRSLGLIVRAFLAGIIVLGLSGCYGAPEEDRYAIANGANAEVGSIEVRSLLIVASDKNEPGRLLATLFNTSDEPVDVTLSDENDSITVRVEGNGDLGLDTNPVIFASVSDIPGSRVPVTVKVGTASAKVDIPVLDGTLEAYRPYLPTGTPVPSP